LEESGSNRHLIKKAILIMFQGVIGMAGWKVRAGEFPHFVAGN
jgi:hypothetical protein